MSATKWMGAFGLVAVLGCSSGTPMTDVDAGFFRCSSDSECPSDGQDCTIDSCGVGGTCSYTPVDERCGAGESCIAGRGCVAGTTCDDNADCEDSIACTIDSCGVDRMCRHMPIHERCTDSAAPMCDPASGCVAGSGCTGDADCDDSVACTLDTCGADTMCRHMPINARCGAGETCSPTLGCFTPMPCTTAAECQDGNFCNGAEVCMPEFGCAPAESPRACDDSEACTVDSCDATTDMCVFRCDPTLGAACAAMCPPPAAGCSGTFNLTGTTMGSCASFTSFDFSQVVFENADGVLSVRARSYTTTPPLAGGLILSDAVAPVCPEFDAAVTITGDCAETYRLTGTFTDDDHFTGTLSWSYSPADLCDFICGGPGSSSVSGTRAP